MVDNGVRCFLPPCFNFELRGSSGDLLTIVSEVVLVLDAAQAAKRDFDAIDYMSINGLVAVGRVVEYDAGGTAKTVGRRFEVTRLEPLQRLDR